MKKTIVSTLFIPIVSYAGWFGPSNFQDCVLEGMKGVNGDQAARMVAMACRQKFPEKPAIPIAPSPPAEVAEMHSFMATSANRPTLNLLISQIQINRMSTVTHGRDYGYGVKSGDFGYHLEIEVTNRNDFPIYGLAVGIPKSGTKKCGWSEIDYAEIYECTGNVGGGVSGSFRCDIPRIQNRRVSVCGIGFAYYGTATSVDVFMKAKNIPRRDNN